MASVDPEPPYLTKRRSPEFDDLDFRALVESLPLVVYVDALDDVSSALYMSPQVEGLLGYPVEQWLDEPDFFVRILHPQDRERVLEEIAASNRSRELFRSEYRLIAKDGRVVWIEDEAVAVSRKEGYAVGYMVDITARKDGEAAYAQLIAERAVLAGQLALEAEKSEFLATASHELRTPLATVYGGAQTLLKRTLSEADRSRLLAVMIAESDRLRIVLDELLTASKLQAGALELALAPVDVRAVVRDAVVSARHRVGDTIEIDFEDGAEPVNALAEPERLRQIVENLLDNAVKYSLGRGRIVVQIHTPDERVEISVRDEGMGIPESERDRIFEKFHRARPAVELAVAGTGLGLYIVRALAERMNGRIHVESTEGRGSCFTLTLRRSWAEQAVIGEMGVPA